MGTTRTTVTMRRPRDTLGNVQGPGLVRQPHRGACSHTKGSTVGVVYRLTFRSDGVRVYRSLQGRSLWNTQPTRPRLGSRPCLGTPRGAHRMGNYSSPLSNPGPCPPTPLPFYALHACWFRLIHTHHRMATHLPLCLQHIRRSRPRAGVPARRHR